MTHHAERRQASKSRSSKHASRRTRRKCLRLELLEDRRLLASDYVVNTISDLQDTIDDGVIDVDPNTPGNQLSFREAIRLANNDPNSIISFDLPNNSTIEIGSTGLGQLPTITEKVNIFGPGLNDRTLTLDGGNQNFSALVINATGAVVSGLRIVRFGNFDEGTPSPAILIQGGADNFISFNEIGSLSPNFTRTNQGDGVRIESSTGNVIRNNQILQNFGSGVVISGLTSRHNALAANTIQFNVGDGVIIENASENVIGGNGEGSIERNNISAQEGNGIVVQGSFASLNTIQGNVIGLDENLIDELGNRGNGVLITDGAFLNRVGTAGDGRNIISGNGLNGVAITGQSDTNRVANNIIGLDGLGTIDPATGFLRRPNRENGVFILQSSGNTIGGPDIASQNTISGNEFHGIYIVGDNAQGNEVSHNLIGTDPQNIARQRNGGHGVFIEDAPANIIGGIAPNNFIAGNDGDGIRIEGLNASSNQVKGNFLGASSQFPIANSGDAIAMVDAPENQIGGTAGGDFNVIASGRGIVLQGPFATGNVVQANFIGVDSQHQVIGGFVQGNVNQFGILIEEASGNFIGGADPVAANSIANLNGDGIVISGILATNNIVHGNMIGVNPAGFTPADGISIKNGIVVRDGASHNQIGGTDTVEGNVVGFTRNTGITVESGIENSLLGNLIFGTVGLPIDLGGDGETENDALDADSGPNQRQNAPTITGVVVEGDSTSVTGVLESSPNAVFRIEFFANPELGDLAAEVFLGAITVNTDQDGIASFSTSFNEILTTVTASATDSQENTSELFSSSLVVNSDGDEPDADPDDGTADVDLSTPGLQVTLRSALEESERRFGRDRIFFQIPTSSPFDSPSIVINSPLPPITQPIVIDGTTQGADGRVLIESIEGAFDGLLIEQGASPFEAVIQGLEIVGFANGIAATATNASLTLGNVDIHNNLDAGVVVFGSLDIVDSSRFNFNGLSGISMEQGAFLQSANVELLEASGNGEFGIQMSSGSLHNVIATNNFQGGINTRTNDLRLTGENVISDNSGPGIMAFGALLEIEHLQTERNLSDGVVAGTIDMIFGGNRITSSGNSGAGIRLTGGLGGILLPDELLGLPTVVITENTVGVLQQNTTGAIDLANVLIENNSGNGIQSLGNITLFGENLLQSNGGIAISSQSTVSVENAQFFANGAGILSAGDVNLSNVQINFNFGDGVSADGQVNVVGAGTVIMGNNGAGIFAGGDVTIDTVSITSNGGIGINTLQDLSIEDGDVCNNGEADVIVGGSLNNAGAILGCSPIVTTTADSGPGSLRNALFSGDTVTFDMDALGPGPHTISLLSPLEIERSVRIEGPGPNLISLNGAGATRLLSITEPSGDINVEISGLTFTNGNALTGDGGAILNDGGQLTLRSVNFFANSGNHGGAIYSVVNESGDIGDGYGGSSSSSLEVIDSIFTNNSAESDGGAIWTDNFLTITRTTIDNNQSGVHGGGVYVTSEDFNLHQIDASTFSNNHAENGDGGGLWGPAQFVISNSTFSGNSASSRGGGIFQNSAGSSSFLRHLTIANNTATSGGGLFSVTAQSTDVLNSIIAGNFGGNVSGQLSSFSGANVIDQDPLLAPLEDNGGSTRTHRLLPDSPAIGNAVEITNFDQRGVDRLGFHDIGAYELAFDFGDAPPLFPVLLSEDGARHIVSGLRLGRELDAEFDGLQSSESLGDDFDFVDDEDGVVFRPAAATFQARMTVFASDSGFVNAWIDFNADGDWNDAGEQVFQDVLVSAGFNNLTYTVPELEGIEPGEQIEVSARVRFSSESGLGFAGLASDGEVEDYQVKLDTVHLPEETGDSFTFQRTVNARERRSYDPEVAVGYVYEVASGPNFATLELLPGFGDDFFTLGIDDGNGEFTDIFTFVAGEEIDFEFDPRLDIAGGISRFRITGIEVEANVDPSNPLGFPTVLSFTEDGEVVFSQTPLIDANDAPVVTIMGAPSKASEGITMHLSAAVTDADPNDMHTLAWEVFKNGTSFASGAGIDFSFTPDDNGVYLVEVIATDSAAATGQSSVTIEVSNATPAAFVIGPDTVTLNENASFTLTASDPSVVDQLDNFLFSIDWDGDGAIDETILGPSGTIVTHVFTEEGDYDVVVTAVDKDGAVSDPTVLSVDVVRGGGGGQPGTAILVDGNLVITGTDADDHITVRPDRRLPGNVRVRINRTFIGSFTPTGIIHVDAGLGNDEVFVSKNLTIDAVLLGGDGNDLLRGGGGNDHLVGGDGNDELRATLGDDILEGGNGDDLLRAGQGNDQLFGGDGDDELRGYLGADLLYGEAGNDLIRGGGDGDVIDGGDGNDELYGGRGDDLIRGGGGDDHIRGGGGNDILLGGDGDDRIEGNGGRDLMIGGQGADALFGGADEDVLLAGTSVFDDHDEALGLLLEEWVSCESYATRVQNLTSGMGSLSGTGIFLASSSTNDDDDCDTLEGDGGVDLFFYNFAGPGNIDSARDWKRNGRNAETRIDLD